MFIYANAYLTWRLVLKNSTPEQASDKAEVQEKKVRSSGGPMFPRDSLSRALTIARAIEDNNAGKPYDRLDLAKATDWSPNSSGFRILITSASRYGLTEGSYIAPNIALTSLGSAIVAPTDSNTGPYLRQALLKPDLFNQIYSFYDKKQIPREEFFKNSLKKQFGVAPEDVEACYKIIMENIKDLGIANDIKGNQFLQLDKLGNIGVGQSYETGNLQAQEQIEGTPEPEAAAEPLAAAKPVNKQIFIAHGKNKKPLEQLIHILQKYKIPHIVASDEPHKGRPVGVKVAQEMKKCTSGIFIFTGDEETKDPEGNIVMRPRDNVVYELGAGSVLYEDKIIILREEGVELPSDFSEVGHVTFEKDNLNAKGLELMTELAGLDIIKFTVT